MYLIIDNYDSFTYNLADLVAETGRDVEVRPCDAIGLGEIAAMKPEGIILSPGPKGPADAWQSLAIVQDFEKTTPILGICLGMEVLAYAAGASVIRGKRPMHGKVTAIHHDGRGLFKGLPKTFSVTRYHSLVVQKAACLLLIGLTPSVTTVPSWPCPIKKDPSSACSFTLKPSYRSTAAT